MDAIQYLRQEHSKFRTILKRLAAMQDVKRRHKKFAAFCLELQRHEKMEQRAWYPVLRKNKELNKIIQHLVSEEKSAADAIKKFKKTGYDLIWNLRFYKFSHDVDHHATGEEKKLFPKVRQQFSKKELTAFGIKMRKFKRDLKK